MVTLPDGRQSTLILTTRCHYFPKAGRRRKNAILTTTLHYFPRVVSGRQSERVARRAREEPAEPKRPRRAEVNSYTA